MLRSLNTKIIVFIFILLSIILLVFRELYLYGGFINNFRIQTDISNHEDLPKIRWTAITSGKLSNYLDKSISKEELWKNVDTNISSYSLLNNYLFSEREIDYPTPKITVGEYESSFAESKYPFKTVAFFKTSYKNQQYIVVVQAVKNSDSTTTWIPLLTNENMLYSTNGGRYYHEYLVNHQLNTYPSPILFFKDELSCKQKYLEFDKYCSWYYDNNDTISRESEIINSMLKYTIFTKDMERVPFLIKLVLVDTK